MKDQIVRPAPAGLVLAVFFVITFGGAAVLGPLIFCALHPVVPVPFHRAMDRALLISALAGLVFFHGRIPLARLWPFHRRALLQLALGYLIAFISAQTMIAFDLAFHGLVSAHLHGGVLAGRIAVAVVAGLIVPPLEETVFRGFLVTELAGGLGRRWGCMAAAVIFTLAHFLKVPTSLDGAAIHPWSGFQAVGDAFLPLAHGEFLGGKGLNLFLVGVILGGVFLRSGALWIGAALHSGWIIALLLAAGLTRPLEPARLAFLEGFDLLSSPLTTLVLLGVGFWLWHYYPPPSDPSETGETVP